MAKCTATTGGMGVSGGGSLGYRRQCLGLLEKTGGRGDEAREGSKEIWEWYRVEFGDQ